MVLALVVLNLLGLLGLTFFLFYKLHLNRNREADLLQEQLAHVQARGNQDVLNRVNETFTSVVERLTKIDEAQKKIEGLSSNIVGLQDVLTDKKSRGIFGEIQLYQILTNVFGEGEIGKKVYEKEKTLSNGKRVDALLKLPPPWGHLPVDSKFPLENYKRMVDKTLREELQNQAQRDFGRDLKKHIDDIAEKYLGLKDTSDQAILFLPAEAIFAEIHAYHPKLVQHAQARRVWLASPTTFLAILTTVQSILLNMERSQYMDIIHREINELGRDFGRYQDRWNNLARHVGNVQKDVEEIHTTSRKISHRFEKIMQVDLPQHQRDERELHL